MLVPVQEILPPLRAPKRLIQIVRRRDQGQVTESLRRVPQLLTRHRNLLRENVQMIAEGEGVFKHLESLSKVFLVVRTGLRNLR